MKFCGVIGNRFSEIMIIMIIIIGLRIENQPRKIYMKRIRFQYHIDKKGARMTLSAICMMFGIRYRSKVRIYQKTHFCGHI
ncbi:MAG: hypothetical protein C4522_19430 [Desulfobacteraceae bacterium]|nr:MAG: hypothetical protein C4522_19430 [Desulfobacteraceae bacterium]